MPSPPVVIDELATAVSRKLKEHHFEKYIRAFYDDGWDDLEDVTEDVVEELVDDEQDRAAICQLLCCKQPLVTRSQSRLASSTTTPAAAPSTSPGAPEAEKPPTPSTDPQHVTKEVTTKPKKDRTTASHKETLTKRQRVDAVEENQPPKKKEKQEKKKDEKEAKEKTRRSKGATEKPTATAVPPPLNGTAADLHAATVCSKKPRRPAWVDLFDLDGCFMVEGPEELIKSLDRCKVRISKGGSHTTFKTSRGAAVQLSVLHMEEAVALAGPAGAEPLLPLTMRFSSAAKPVAATAAPAPAPRHIPYGVLTW